MRRREPDWEELRSIGRRAEAASAARTLDYDGWRALLAEADNACNGHRDFSEFMFSYARAGWADRLMAETGPQLAAKPPGAT